MLTKRALGVGLLIAILMAPSPAFADKPATGCPAAKSGFESVDADGWWTRTVIGFAEEGLSLEEAAMLFGVSSVGELEVLIKDTIMSQWDKNDNGFICMKDLPNTPGNLGFLFNATDDNSSKP